MEKPLSEADVVAGDLGFRSSKAAMSASASVGLMVLAIVATVAVLI